MSALDNVLSRLDNVEQEGDGYRASCPLPAHGVGRGDRNPSLSVDVDQQGNVLINCFAGCASKDIVSALELTTTDLFERGNGLRGGDSYTSPVTEATDQPTTLENYADYVGLPVDFLKRMGLKEYRHLGEPAVSMPYLDESGENVLLTRSRISLTGKPKVKTARAISIASTGSGSSRRPGKLAIAGS